ncbi:MAG: HAMP domain-containing histidine kinase, partial [Inquilinus sp.]|nr:HAMP domain-containing histidine kinase [Inquilinus sp.]
VVSEPQQSTFPAEGFDDPGEAAPAAAPQAAPAPASTPAPSARTTEYGHGSSSRASGGRGRILAVDDDVDMVDGLAEVLDAHGYEVKTANDQDGAIKTIQDYDAQVALLDIRLGNSNGLDLISRLKEYRPNLYCIVITGNADKESAVTALRNGAYDYMTKPLHPSELFSVIERCLDKHRLEARADATFDALQIAKDAAEMASKAKSQFFGTMSRELRKPITAIMNSANALMEQKHGELGAPQYMDHARNIRNGSSHLLGIIGYALDMAEAEAGRLELKEAEVDLGALIKTAVRVVQQTHRADQRSIEVNLPDPSPKVWGDQRLLKQIVMNLVSNAVKFTPDEGKMQVGLRWNDQGGLSFEVKDTGIGIAKEDLPKALAQFGRVENAAVPRDRQGAGLGLPLVVAMTELHGGKLKLESEPGVGTTATVNLPSERMVNARSAAE